MVRPAPHDLVLLESISKIKHEGERPSWLQSPWAVVRRCSSKLVPIGFRGTTRDQRFAAFTDTENILRVVTPRSLVATTSPRDLPHFAALAQITDSMRGLEWGPAGSAGYELATGAPTLTAQSDLDILIYADKILSRDFAKTLLEDFSKFKMRVDAQIETPMGAIALSEWAGRSARVALRTSQGPSLTDNPWARATI